MNITKTSKKFADKVEEKVKKGLEVAKGTFDNVASHLPFANLAKRSDDIFSIEIDFPGVKKEDIEIKVEDNYLTVNAQRRYKNETKEDDYYLCESSFGLFSRSFALSDNIDRQSIDAKYENGRLYIMLEKAESKKSKRIAIK
ncbi:Hsp20/alpha crystallin family protein [Sulfurimonas sp.]|jgi:HSP20 family protein|uniref:Hsp20/alpha crystallin family protein n=1 Tax=Sulfurimonas sp. TaxID=2022749 RepID=UPI0025DDA483|nr:Hsp20/alpha crystallin family protein [Sulfurimonas sp.]MCK9473961.1 Hsp20/alpha crystallin family protein [Sulfurimonas sp.]